MSNFDIIVIGAGIAGVSVAAHLARSHRTLILEMEDRPGYHATGRSAASFEPNYGPAPMLAFTRASEAFFRNPPSGFCDAPLICDRDSLFFEAEGQEHHTTSFLADSAGLVEISLQEAKNYLPVLRDGYANRCFLDRQTGDIDVDLLHTSYLKQFKGRGGTLALKAKVEDITRSNGAWRVKTSNETFSCATIVNAAGAWGDEVAKLASVSPIGLTPKRRSIGIVPITGYPDFHSWPMMTDIGETWYAKPQSGKLIVSSADATAVEPHDAFGDDLAIAQGIECLMNATTLQIERLDHNFGGLRTFALDGNPVVGYDTSNEDFFWLVGQGGYGIQSCPALSTIAADLILGRQHSLDVPDLELNLEYISPKRLAN